MVTRVFTNNKNWSWVGEEDIDVNQIQRKHVDTVYRMDANPCTFGSCKTNCTSNPYCLNGIGEKKLINFLQKDSNELIERSTYFRQPEEYVGLVNLGATCYINAYLQVWFNNIFFRENILGIKFEQMQLDYDEENLENKSETMREFRVKPSQCLATNLQLIFSLMKDTIRKSINPEFFIKAIGLDASEQQDAQEFSQLFLTTLQTTLTSPPYMSIENKPRYSFGTDSKNSEFKPNDLVQDLFQGECGYITKCEICNHASKRNSNFIELSLNIQNSQTIKQCIDELLKDEFMDGENRYYCSQCGCKQNATRSTKLNRLPPILNLQLLRFVYDRNNSYKKKLNTRIRFSEVLDLSTYMNDSQSNKDNKDQCVYHLGAILMHVGKSAYSGHYTAQIRDFATQEWNTFNDEVITNIKKKQQLGCTEEEIESKSQVNEEPSTSASSNSKQQKDQQQKDQQQKDQQTKEPAGSKTFSTANAYLLVYYRADLVNKMPKCFSQEKNATASELSSNQSKTINKDNELLEAWFKDMRASKLESNEQRNTEKSIMHTIYESLWIIPNKSNNVQTYAMVAKKNQPRQNSGQKSEAISAELTEKAKSPSPIEMPMATPTSKNDYFFIPTDFLKKWFGSDSSPTNFEPNLGATILNKYLCQHRRLNPLAISKMKLVSRKGLEAMKSYFELKPSEVGALDAQNDDTTRCNECVDRCFEYLKCREKLKQEAKEVKSLQKYEYNDGVEGEPKMVRSPMTEGSDDLYDSGSGDNENDVIFIDSEKKNEKNKEKSLNDIKSLKKSIHISQSTENSHSQKPKTPNNNQLSFESTESNNYNKSASVSHKNNNNNNTNGNHYTSSTNMKAQQNRPELWYWVGKESLRQWNTLALKKYEQDLPSFKFAEQEAKLISEAVATNMNNEITEITEIPQTESPSEVQEIQPTSNGVTATAAAATAVVASTSAAQNSNGDIAIISSTLNSFNEDILCQHGDLSPTLAKRLVCEKLWKIIKPYFYNDPEVDNCCIFTAESSECKFCLIQRDEQTSKKMLVKTQKDILPNLYSNKSRLTLPECDLLVTHYLIMADFVKQWRGMIKNTKYQDLQIFNKSLLCQHGFLPFNENTFDETMVTLLTPHEWEYLASNYDYDQALCVTKVPLESTLQAFESDSDSNQNNEQRSDEERVKFKFEFKPKVCDECIAQNEIEKYTFERKKITIRILEEEEPAPETTATTTNTHGVDEKNENAKNRRSPNTNEAASTVASKRPKSPIDNNAENENGDDDVIPKKPRIDNEPTKYRSERLNKPKELTYFNSEPSIIQTSGIRRSKRSRKCKDDFTIEVSSCNTIMEIKKIIAKKLSKMVSEQHLFFRNVELENNRPLKEYMVNAGDTLCLKIDAPTNTDDTELPHYELAHIPEIGFKGTNLLR